MIAERSGCIQVTHNKLKADYHKPGRFVVDKQLPLKAVTRRACVTGGIAAISGASLVRAAGLPNVRLGTLQYGTVQWVSDIIRRHALDSANGFSLATTALANTDAGRVALMAGAADIVVSDWMFVATQRAAGTRLCFAPFSSSTGGILVPDSSAIRSLAQLAQHKLGVAGGPVDKSWLIVRAAAKGSSGLDLTQRADVVYGAPPLLNAKLMQGELDAVLTYWNFAARLEAANYRQIVSVSECGVSLGLPAAMSLVGFVFHEEWATQHTEAINGFLNAAAAAEASLAQSDAEWQQIRPLMNAPEDALFQRLKQRFVEGVSHPTVPTQESAAAQLFEILLRTGGMKATDGLAQLPPGIFWPTPASHG